MGAVPVDEIAQTLRRARTGRCPVQAPTATWNDLDVSAAIAVQLSNVEVQLAEGDRVVGYKLGNVAKAMQSKFGLDQPDYGHLLASTFAYEGGTLAMQDFIAPFVELEAAFILGRPLQGPHVTVADVVRAVDHVVPAIEVIDSRVTNWEIALPDTLADNGSTGKVIIGGVPRSLRDLPLHDLPGKLFHQGIEVASGSTKAVLGNPLSAVAHVCNTLSQYDIGFEAGQLILAGSILAAVPMREGHWSGRFDGWGSIEFNVVSEAAAA